MTRLLRMLLLSVVAALVLGVSASAALAAKEHTFVLTLVHTNDGESKLLQQTTAAGEAFGGIAPFATLVDRLRDEGRERQPGDFRARIDRGAITVSSGDNFLAGPQFNASLEKGVPFYDTIGLDLVGYDASAIGNHEFDFGPEVAADFIRGFGRSFPIISANLDVSGESSLARLARRGRITGSVIVRSGGERIGVVGSTTPLLPAISSPGNVVADPDVVGAVQAEIDQLGRRGVNKIVYLSHLQGIDEDVTVVQQLRGVDLVVSGGGQERLANPDDVLIPGDTATATYPQVATDAGGKSVYIVTTSGEYEYVGALVATFDRAGEIVDIDEAKSGPVRVFAADGIEPDAEIQAQVIAPVQAAVDALAANVVGTSEVALDGRRSPGVRSAETNLGSLLADAVLWQAQELAPSFGVDSPQIALQNGGSIRNSSLIPAGNITELDTFSVCAFVNFVSIVPDVPRERLKEILENAVSKIPADPSAPPATDGRFAQIAGFTFAYDPTGTAQVIDLATGQITTPGTRVMEVTLDDGTVIVSERAVQTGDPVDVATVDFLARGGDQYPFGGAPFTSLLTTYQVALEGYIQGPLTGAITAADYPEGGEGRITTAS